MLARMVEVKANVGGAFDTIFPYLPFQVDESSLALGCNFTFNTPFGPLDLLGYLEPLGDYDAILTNSSSMDVGGLVLRIIDLDDLIKIKEHLQRPKDRESILQLHAIKRVRSEQES
jgi:hypothetical protein